MLTYRPAYPTWSQSILHLLRAGTWALPGVLGQKEELGVEQIKKPGHAQHSRCIDGCSLPGLLNTYLAPVRSLFLMPPNMTSLSTKRWFSPPLLLLQFHTYIHCIVVIFISSPLFCTLPIHDDLLLLY